MIRARYPAAQLAAARFKDPARALVRKTPSALATVYACPFCNEAIVIRRPRPGHGDRGFGLRTGGPAHAKMGAHIRSAHAEKVADILANAAELAAQPQGK